MKAHRSAAVEPTLAAARYIDSKHPAVVDFATAVVDGAMTPTARAVALFYAVRDRIRYNPYVDYGDLASYTASGVLGAGEGYCVGKAALLCAAARAVGIAARLGLADVRNHLATPQLRALMQTDVFACHGYAELCLEGRWIKVTPTFNIELCERFGVHAIDFDGRADALFHAFDREGRLHMEYVHDRGSFDDVPVDMVVRIMRDSYPRLWQETVAGGTGVTSASAARFASEAEALGAEGEDGRSQRPACGPSEPVGDR